jgi:tRNA(Met) cytidine acetyltransferase
MDESNLRSEREPANLNSLSLLGQRFFSSLRTRLIAQKQRAIVRLSGSEAWADAVCHGLQSQDLKSLSVVDFTEPDHLKTANTSQRNEWRLKHYPKYLGTECDVLILNAHQGLNVNAFAALAGIVKLGGIIILQTPDDKSWLESLDPESSRFTPALNSNDCVGQGHFTEYFLQCLNKHSQLTVSELKNIRDIEAIQSGGNVSPVYKVTEASWPNRCPTLIDPEVKLDDPILAKKETGSSSSALTPNTDQLNAIEQICNLVASQQRNSSLLLCADRGRGKSAAIGMALSELASRNTTPDHNLLHDVSFTLTGPNEDAVGILLQHANANIKLSTKPNSSGLVIQFQSTDELLDTQTKPSDKNTYSVLIIDEAAALPVSTVQQLVAGHDLAILSTTIHGYEGTGRGFEFKLKPWLKEHFSSYHEFWLNEPIRWSKSDNVEMFINRSLCASMSLPNSESTAINTPLQGAIANDLSFAIETAQSLIQTKQVQAVHSLLANAHYQTTPNDLRALLDNPNLLVVTAYTNTASKANTSNTNELVATALVSIEGGFDKKSDADLVEQIWQGRRRPRGHLAPQSLVTHCGYKEAAYLRFARVIRIAVRPKYQGQNIGSALLKWLKQEIKSQKEIPHTESQTLSLRQVDFLSTSFGLEPDLLSFWKNNGYMPVRLGLKRETSSGLYSILMLDPISSKAKSLMPYWQARFNQTNRAEQTANLRPQLELLFQKPIQRQSEQISQWSNKQDELDLISFTEHYRSADSCYLAMQSLLGKNTTNFELLRDKFVHGVQDLELIQKHKLSGIKQLIQTLRAETKRLKSVCN